MYMYYYVFGASMSKPHLGLYSCTVTIAILWSKCERAPPVIVSLYVLPFRIIYNIYIIIMLSILGDGSNPLAIVDHDIGCQ